MNLSLKHKTPVKIKVHDMLSELRAYARDRDQTFVQTRKYKKGKFAFAFFDKKTGERVSDLLTIREAYKLIGDSND